MMPMLIGHSQGGMLAMRTLHELAGDVRRRVPGRRSARPRAALPRTTIVDPLHRRERPVVGLHVGVRGRARHRQAAARAARQWSMLPRLREIPDTVAEFTGFRHPGRPDRRQPLRRRALRARRHGARAQRHAAGELQPHRRCRARAPRRATRHARVDRRLRTGRSRRAAGAGGRRHANLVHAADIWHSVKQHWCLEAQRGAARRGRPS